MRRALLVLLPILVGCHTTTFEITEPASAIIAPGKPLDLPANPLRFQFLTTDDHLTIKIFNPTTDTIRLLGAESSAVDPRGHSHPLMSQTIAAHASVEMILPPPRPWGSGGAVGIGLMPVDTPDARFGYPDAGPPPAPDFPADPYDGPLYWDWSDKSAPVRLRFVFDRDKSPLIQQFVISRVDR